MYRWVVDHAPFGKNARPLTSDMREAVVELSPAPVTRATFPRGKLVKVTLWELAPPSCITYHDTLSRKGKTAVLVEERWSFFGGERPGSILGISVHFKPVEWADWIGFA